MMRRGGIAFWGLKSGQKQGGRCLRKNYTNNYSNIETYLIFIDSESIDTKKAFQMLPNRLQIGHWKLVFLLVSLWGVDLV